jgi:hypothetical protein
MAAFLVAAIFLSLGTCPGSATTHPGDCDPSHKRKLEIATRIPMDRMQVGVAYNQPPFDVEEFIKQVEQRTQN